LFPELESLCPALGRGVRRCVLVLEHRYAPPTRIRLGTLEVVQDGARLQAQAALHLARTPLPEPATAVVLHASRLESVTPAADDLFIDRTDGEAWSTLVERLRARLGATAVMQLAVVADHRPARASREESPRRRTASFDSRTRLLRSLTSIRRRCDRLYSYSCVKKY